MAIRSTASVTVRDLGWSEIKRNIRGLDRNGVKAGILARDARKRGKALDAQGNLAGPSDATVVEYATWNEFGVRSAHVRIPARPFMRRTADTSKREVGDAAAGVVDAVLYGRTPIWHALDRLGKWYVERIRQMIMNSPSWAVPLAPRTIRRKGHAHPLIVFHILFDTLDYKLDRKKP